MVEGNDPLASPTLAQLYLSQGHMGKARKVIQDILAQDPTQGHALALLHRVHAQGSASISAHPEDLTVHVRWRVRDPGLASGAPLHVVVVTHGPRPGSNGGGTASRVSSVPCTGKGGELHLDLPEGPASACIALARFDENRRLQILAAAEPLSWS